MTAVKSLYLYLLTGVLFFLPMGTLSLCAQTLVIDAEKQYQYAEQLNAEGRFRQAAEEYERFAFFFPQDPRQRMARFKSASAFFKAGDIDTALERFNPLTHGDALDHVAIESFFMMTECYLAGKQYGQAILQMRNLIVLSDQQHEKDRAYERIGWIRIDQMDWEGARRAFGRMTPSAQDEHQIDRLDAALEGASQLPYKAPALAGALSIVPGAGQLYCGRYEDALAAFLVNGALIWASYESFDHDLNALGGLLAFVGVGFYASNIYGAVSSAHKYNLSQKQRYGEQLRQQHLTNRYPPDERLRSGSDPRFILSFRLPF